MELSVILLLIIIAICTIWLYYFTMIRLSHFERLNIPHVKPIPFLGNIAPFVFRRLSIPDNIQQLYNLFSDAKYFGFYEFMTPFYVIRDPDLINSICIKNFDHFCDHRYFVNPKIEPMIAKNLFNQQGDNWRELRRMLSPSYTSSKMKIMFQSLSQCADYFTNFLVTDCGKSGKTYDIKDIMSKFTTDVVASCVFSINVDSLKNPNNEFHLLNKKLEKVNDNGLKITISRNCDWLMQFLRFQIFDNEIQTFCKNIVEVTLKVRNEKEIIQPDMMQMMMDNRTFKPTFDQMISQALVFLFGGFDFVSTSISFLIHEVGICPDIQNKLAAEIDDVVKQTKGEFTYEAIMGMKYLDAVVNETLRMYPLLPSLDRVCTKDFEMPPATPNGKPIRIKRGENILISCYALQRDPKYYSEPNKFIPERFLNGEVKKSTFLSFGIGPRICIAHRFVRMEMKIIIFYLLWRCKLGCDPKTDISRTLRKDTYFVTKKTKYWLKLQAKDLIE